MMSSNFSDISLIEVCLYNAYIVPLMNIREAINDFLS